MQENLDSQVGEERVRKLLRPFANLNRTVGFVHESLKYAVLHEFPILADAAPSTQQLWTGAGGIEGVMLRTCVDYLMLEDFNWTETIPDEELVGGEMSQVHQEMWNGRRKKILVLDNNTVLSIHGAGSFLEAHLGSPFGAFFQYAARNLTDHLGSAPDDFNLDDVLEIASPTSGRNKAWMLESQVRYPNCTPPMKPSALCLIAGFGSVSMLEQQLNRLAQNGDVDTRLIVAAATTVIERGNPGNFQILMNHRSTAMAMQTVEMLKSLIHGWKKFRLRSDDLAEWTRLIRGLFDTLASDTIPSPKELLQSACAVRIRCIPAIEKLCERAKADPAFRKKLMQSTDGIGPLGTVTRRGNVATLPYFCPQGGIKHYSSQHDRYGRPILDLLSHKTGIIELLLGKNSWLYARTRAQLTPQPPFTMTVALGEARL